MHDGFESFAKNEMTANVLTSRNPSRTNLALLVRQNRDMIHTWRQDAFLPQANTQRVDNRQKQKMC